MVSRAVLTQFERHRTLSPGGREALEQALREERHLPHRAELVLQGQSNPGLLFVTGGWAARVQYLRGGSRQITAFLMEGDLCNPEALCVKREAWSLFASILQSAAPITNQLPCCYLSRVLTR